MKEQNQFNLRFIYFWWKSSVALLGVGNWPTCSVQPFCTGLDSNSCWRWQMPRVVSASDSPPSGHWLCQSTTWIKSILENLITTYLVLPESHSIIRGPAKDKPKHQHPGHFYCLDSSLANHSLAAEGSAINMGITGPLEYHGDFQYATLVSPN